MLTNDVPPVGPSRKLSDLFKLCCSTITYWINLETLLEGMVWFFYYLNVMHACLVVNPITVNNFAALFNCTPAGQASYLLTTPTQNILMKLVGFRCSTFGWTHRGSTLGVILLHRFSVGLAIEHSSWFMSVLNLDLHDCGFDELIREVLPADRMICTFIDSSRTYAPSPSNLLLTVLRRCFSCGLFYHCLSILCLAVTFCSFCWG